MGRDQIHRKRQTKMATATATAPTIESFKQEMAAPEGELKTLKDKRAAEEKNLTALETERGKISEAIAVGTLKAAAATELARKISESKAACDGFNAIITRKDKRYGEASLELSTQEAEAKRAAEMDEISNLKAEGAAILQRIADTLKDTIGVEIFRYNDIRKRLGKVMDNAMRTGGFPIPAVSLAARDARGELDKQLAVVLMPVQKMIGR
jgi:septal ring factor EnvC (AmiA/AmiB activator)